MTGLGTTFVATALVTTATSLPELDTSWTVVEISAGDLMIGNLARLERRILFVELDALLILMYLGGFWILKP